MASDSTARSALPSARSGTPLRPLALLLALCSALAITLAASAGTARAARGGNPGPNDGNFNPGSDRRSDHCITPTGVDLNELFGISAQIVTEFCGSVDSGEFWTPGALWVVNTTFASTPPGFVPAGATPLEDFVAKFVSAKYIVDPGSRQARTHVFQKTSRLWTGQFPEFAAVNTATLGLLRPLRPGQHLVEVYWVFKGMHCDGLAAVVSENCLQAGENLVYRIPFKVTAPAP